MPKLLLSVALLGVLVGCKPVSNSERVIAEVENIISQLGLKIERIEPKLRTALPLEQSSLDIVIYLDVENPTAKPLNARSFLGKLEFDQNEASHMLGDVSFQGAVSIPPGAAGQIPIALNFKYNDVKNAWRPLANVALGHKTVWKLSGNLEISSAFSNVNVPVRLSKTTSGGDAE